MVVSRQAYANGCLERDVHAMFEYVLACMHVGTASFCKPQILVRGVSGAMHIIGCCGRCIHAMNVMQ